MIPYNNRKTALHVFLSLVLILTLTSVSFGETDTEKSDTKWTIYYRPAVRFGTDNRTLYINDFLIPVYRNEKNILFTSIKYTPNDEEGWEVNLGLGYRHYFPNANLILGVSGFYDKRKVPWGKIYEQWGIGTEAMTEIPVGSLNLGVTSRINYYHPITSGTMIMTPLGDIRYIFKGHGLYAIDPFYNAYIEEPLGGVDGEIGFRIPYVSDYVETWVYGGGYHFEGKYSPDIDGVVARIEVIPTDFLRLNYEYRSDRTEHNQHYGEVAIEVPFSIEKLVAGKNPFEGIGKRLGGSRELKERLAEPVRRDVDVVVKKYDNKTALKILVANGILTMEEAGITNAEMEKIIFVSENGSDETGDGSYERPYNSIGAAFKNSYVRGREDEPGVFVGRQIKLIHVIDDTNNLAVKGGTADVPGITIWGGGFAVLPTKPSLNTSSILNYKVGYPIVDTQLEVDSAGRGISIYGLYFNNTTDRSGIFLRQGEGIIIESNSFRVRNTEAYGIDTISRIEGALSFGISSTEGSPLSIFNNFFMVSSDDGNAGGIRLNIGGATDKAIVSISNNEFEIYGNEDAYAIGLFRDILLDEDIGVSSSISILNNKKIKVRSEESNARGVYANIENNELYTLIDSNNFDIKTNGSGECYGIDINITRDSNLGTTPVAVINEAFKKSRLSYISKLLNAYDLVMENAGDVYFNDNGIYNNTFCVESPENSAYGIRINSKDSTWNDIKINKIGSISSGIDGKKDSYAIYLESVNRDVDSYIDGNTLYVNSSNADAYGISVIAGTDIRSHIQIPTNYITVQADSGSGYGIKLLASKGLYGEIENVQTPRKIIGNNDSYGIYFAGEEIGSDNNGSYRPFIISNNTLSVNSIAGEAYGIRGSSIGNDSIDEMFFAEITGNILNKGITGDGKSYGIFLDSLGNNTGSEVYPVLISGNHVAVTSYNDSAYGIYCHSASAFLDYINSFFVISDNELKDIGRSDTHGIYLYTEDKNRLGSICNSRSDIMSNLITAQTMEKTAYGIYLESDGTLISSISNNMNVNVIGKEKAYDLFVSADYVGVNDFPLIVYGNTFKAGSDGETYGIYAYSPLHNPLGSPEASGTVFVDTLGNNMLNRIKGKDNAYGIKLEADTIRAYLESDKMDILSATGSAYGVYLDSVEDIDSSTIKHTEITVTGQNEAHGIHIESDGTIGSEVKAFRLNDNSMTVTSETGIAAGISLKAEDSIYAGVGSDGISGPTLAVTGNSNGNAYGILLNAGHNIALSVGSTYIEEGLPPVPVGVGLNVESELGAAYGIYAVDDTFDDLGIGMSIINSTFTVTGSKESVGIKLVGKHIVPSMADNFFRVTSENGDAAGIFMLGRDVGYVDPDRNIFEEISGGSGISVSIIDAVVAESKGTLDDEITNGTTGWIFVRSGDYHDVAINPNRENLTLWGEGLSMFGFGSGDAPVFYDDSDNFTQGDFETGFSGNFRSVFGIEFHDPPTYVELTLTDIRLGHSMDNDYPHSAVTPYGVNTPGLPIEYWWGEPWRATSAPGWWGYIFYQPQIVTKIDFLPGYSTYQAGGTKYYGVQNFLIQATNGYYVKDHIRYPTGWTTLYSGTHPNNDSTESCEFSNTTAYKYYRIYIYSGYRTGARHISLRRVWMFSTASE